MSIFRLSFSNFKRSLREYGMLILSLGFSVFIFFNFQNMVYSDSMKVLQEFKKDYIDMIIQAASVVFVVFLFFFIWYAVNVFLRQRKKEIGIYIFMGVDNAGIGKMFALEALFMGLSALISGLFFGVLFSKLFQMLLLRMSEISVEIRFSLSLKPMVITGLMFGSIYGFMILKGYYSLKKSSVLSLISGAKQKEITQRNPVVSVLLALFGGAVLAAGYFFAWDTKGLEALEHGLLAVILVIVGIYLLFDGLIPELLKRLIGNKKFLYKKERSLWMNSLAFRMKKNYRTYAIVTVLMICSVTVVAISIAMKQRYEKMVNFDQTYTYQVLSSQRQDGAEIKKGIEEENTVEYWNEYEVLILPPEVMHTKFTNYMYGVIPWSQVKEGAKRAGLEFSWEEPSENQVIMLEHEILISLMGDQTRDKTIEIGTETYEILGRDKTPYLGNIQSMSEIFVVSDETYTSLMPLGQVEFFYNYRIKDLGNAEKSRPFLKELAEKGREQGVNIGVNFSQGTISQDSWIRILYSLCLFMFATLILAAGSVLFLKTGNEAYEDKERYGILEKIGVQRTVLKQSVRKEICFTYYCPFVLTCLTSYFSVKALGNVMQEELFRVNLWSAGIIFLVFTCICFFSVREAWKRLFD